MFFLEKYLRMIVEYSFYNRKTKSRVGEGRGWDILILVEKL
jgi:hypothetical protein